MAKDNELVSLKSACGTRGASDVAERIKDGESFWLTGFPAPAEPGHVALTLAPGSTVTVAESSILEVEKEGERYFVHVKAGAPALVRHEGVFNLSPSNCHCSKPTTTARTKDTGTVGGSSGVLDPGLCRVCYVDWRCILYTPIGSYPKFVCLPILVCEDSCSSA